MNAEHPATGRFSTIVLFGDECAWNPDSEASYGHLEEIRI